MIRRGFRALATIANVLVIAAVCLVAMYAVRDFARYVNHYPYLATDDSMGNVSYALATEGRYGFVSSPNQGFTVVGRHRAFFNYGPWYFYVGAGIIWLFGYSVAALRSIHPGVILIIALAALWWFGRRAELAAGAIVALALIYAFEVSHWPMIRPDVAVSLFAVLAILAAGRAIETRSPLHWFFAGLMAGCALFTHFIAWALAPASALMLMVSWAFDRPAAWRLRLTQLAALFLGGVSAGVMFYASFGFRMRDHLSLIGGYGQFLESGQAATSYRTVLLRHLSLAFDYLSPAARLSLAIAIAGAAALLAVSWWRSADQRRAMVAVVLPPLAVLACYVISLGTYPNYHQGYTILTQVAAWWCAGSAVAVATMLVAERAAVIADLMRIGLGVALVLVAARHIEVRTPASADRLRMAGEWVGIAQYTDRIAEFIPPRATAWGSLVFASENPGRMQLVQFADGVTGVERNLLLRPAGAMALAPEYLVWGYTENRDQLLLSLRRRRDLFGAAERAFPQFRYRLIGLVAGRPYGTTRIYARRIEARTEPPAVMPVVRAYDASTGTWDSALTGPEHPVFRATDPVTFAAGPGDAPPTSADRSVAGDISEGRLLLRVHVAPTVDASRRVLAASTVPAVPDLVRALGPNASFAPYDGRDGEVFLVHDHPGGPLYISQIDDGHGAAIEGVEIYRIGPPLDVRQRPERPLIDLPPFALWVPFVTPGVRATADSGDLVVEGDASPGNYQIRSPPVRVEPQYPRGGRHRAHESTGQGVSRRAERHGGEVARAARRSGTGARVHHRRHRGVRARRRELQRQQHGGGAQPIRPVARRLHGHAARSLRRQSDGAGKDGPGRCRLPRRAPVYGSRRIADPGRIHRGAAVPPGPRFRIPGRHRPFETIGVVRARHDGRPVLLPADLEASDDGRPASAPRDRLGVSRRHQRGAAEGRQVGGAGQRGGRRALHGGHPASGRGHVRSRRREQRAGAVARRRCRAVDHRVGRTMRGRLADLLIVVAIAAAGAWAGGAYRNASSLTLWSIQPQLGAGVALVCGLGFTDPGASLTPLTPAMTEFLVARTRDSVTCADLQPGIPPDRPNFTQGLYRYLLMAIALVWMVSGTISWSGLTPLFAVAYATTLIAAYGIFRVAMGRVMSAVATFALLTSVVHLANLPDFRDYAKAPFILALILIMARLATGPLTPRRSLALSAAFGVVLGIGFGFRNDLLINVLPWAAVVLLCLPGPRWSNLKLKALCLAVSGLLFVATAWPILRAYTRGSNSGHVTLLGLMTTFDERLGVDRSIYNWGHEYNDHLASRLISSFSRREYGRDFKQLSADYDRAAAVYIARIARHFPADVLARVYGSTLGILDDLPFKIGLYFSDLPPGVTDPRLVAFYATRARVIRWLHGMGAPAVLIALVIISARSVAAAVTLLLFLLYFGGYPAMQYSVRHYFHLEFIAWGAIGFVLERAAVALFRRVRRRRHPAVPDAAPPWRTIAGRMATFAALAALLLGVPLAALRVYQGPHLRTLLARSYVGAERQPLAAIKAPVSGDRVVLDLSSMFVEAPVPDVLRSAYLVVELSPRQCDAMQIPMTFRYHAPTPEEGAYHVDARLEPGDRSTLVFFPVFQDIYTQFKGVEMAPANAECVASVSRVQEDRVPDVLLNAVFTPQWERATLYDTFARFETPRRGEDGPVQLSNPVALAVPLNMRPTRFVEQSPNAEFLAPTASRRSDGALVIKGGGPLESWTYYLGDQPLVAGSMLIAKGELRSGIMTLNLISKEGVVTHINVMTPGEFVAAIAVPRTGTYAVTLRMLVTERWIDSHLPGKLAGALRLLPGFRPTHEATLTTLGWLPPRVLPDTEANH